MCPGDLEGQVEKIPTAGSGAQLLPGHKRHDFVRGPPARMAFTSKHLVEMPGRGRLFELGELMCIGTLDIFVASQLESKREMRQFRASHGIGCRQGIIPSDPKQSSKLQLWKAECGAGSAFASEEDCDDPKKFKFETP